MAFLGSTLMNDGGSGCLSVIFIIGIILWLIGAPPFETEISVYPQIYECTSEDGSNCNWRNQARKIYTPIPEAQIVIERLESDDNWIPQKQKNCAVASAKDWFCLDETRGSYFGARDGKFKYEGVHGENTQHVSNYRW